jgi:hypothetical protein
MSRFMKKARFEKLDSYADRVRRSSREIMIASALTLAAIAFLIAALMGGAVTNEKDMGQNDKNMGHVAADETVIK